jgi:hypothetical protein
VRRFFLLSVSLLVFIELFGDNNVPNIEAGNINWITIWLSFFFGVLFTILFRLLNSRSNSIDHRRNAGSPISGWVVFLGLNLGLRIVVQAYFFLTGSYFAKSAWVHLQLTGGSGLQSLMIFEMFLSLFSLAGTGALIYWFIGRRDIFPKMFIYYGCFYLFAILVQIVINYKTVFPDQMMSLRRDGYIQIFRLIYIGVWVLYVWRSEQVKQTFVYPPN